jgi:hypothetical protein
MQSANYVPIMTLICKVFYMCNQVRVLTNVDRRVSLPFKSGTDSAVDQSLHLNSRSAPRSRV